MDGQRAMVRECNFTIAAAAYAKTRTPKMKYAPYIYNISDVLILARPDLHWSGAI